MDPRCTRSPTTRTTANEIDAELAAGRRQKTVNQVGERALVSTHDALLPPNSEASALAAAVPLGRAGLLVCEGWREDRSHAETFRESGPVKRVNHARYLRRSDYALSGGHS